MYIYKKYIYIYIYIYYVGTFICSTSLGCVKSHLPFNQIRRDPWKAVLLVLVVVVVGVGCWSRSFARYLNGICNIVLKCKNQTFVCFLHNICSILGLNLLTFIVFLFSRSRSVIPWACNLQHVEIETAWKQKAQMQRKHIRSNAGKTENKKNQWRRKFPSVFVSAARPDIQKSVCLGISVRFSKQITFWQRNLQIWIHRNFRYVWRVQVYRELADTLDDPWKPAKSSP